MRNLFGPLLLVLSFNLLIPAVLHADAGVDSILDRPQRDTTFWTLRDSEIGAVRSWQVAASTAYDYRPFQVQLNNGPRLRGIDDRFLSHVHLGYIATGNLQVDLELPMAFGLQVYEPATGYSRNRDIVDIGDLEIATKSNLFSWQAWNFGVSPFLHLPTGDAGRFLSAGTVSGGFTLYGDSRLSERWTLDTNLGLYFRSPYTLLDARFSHELQYGVGAAYHFTHLILVRAELLGRMSLPSPFENALANPLEVFVSAERLQKCFSWSLGVSEGLVRGSGAAYTSVFAGVKIPLNTLKAKD